MYQILSKFRKSLGSAALIIGAVFVLQTIFSTVYLSLFLWVYDYLLAKEYSTWHVIAIFALVTALHRGLSVAELI